MWAHKKDTTRHVPFLFNKIYAATELQYRYYTAAMRWSYMYGWRRVYEHLGEEFQFEGLRTILEKSFVCFECAWAWIYCVKHLCGFICWRQKEARLLLLWLFWIYCELCICDTPRYRSIINENAHSVAYSFHIQRWNSVISGADLLYELLISAHLRANVEGSYWVNVNAADDDRSPPPRDTPPGLDRSADDDFKIALLGASIWKHPYCTIAPIVSLSFA